MKETVNLLWTGGLDSTCRLVELSLLDICVQPYYVVDKNRKSLRYEINAMNVILSKLRKKSNVIATIHDPLLIYSVAENSILSSSWNNLYDKYKVGSQYDFLSRFAFENELNLEVGIEKVLYSRAVKAIETEGALLEYSSESGVSEFYLDCSNSSHDLINIFEHLRFPTTLWNMTKLQEVEKMNNLGFADIIQDTWFCHTPVFGYPCGHCNPCKDAIAEGLSFRVPEKGYILGTLREILKFPLRVFSKICRILHLK